MQKQKIEGFKAFDTNKEGKMSCRNFVYEENHSYVCNEKIKPCESGFHFCKNPLDVLNYYRVIDDDMNIRSAFAKVKGSGKIFEEGDKCCCSRIKIEKKLSFSDFINEAIKAIFKMCKTESSSENESCLASSDPNSKLASSGKNSQLASTGDCSRLASSGHYSKLVSSGTLSQLASSGNGSQLASNGNDSQLASSGDNSKLASSGGHSCLASSGRFSQLASSGHSSKLASSGDDSKLATTGNDSWLVSCGNDSKLAANGDYSQLAACGRFSKLVSKGNDSRLMSGGDHSQLESSGSNCIIAGMGYKNIAKGKIGSWIVLAEYNDKYPYYHIKEVKAALIDGEKIKADTFYKLKNGRFVETEA